jgi:hypothetical protein
MVRPHRADRIDGATAAGTTSNAGIGNPNESLRALNRDWSCNA